MTFSSIRRSWYSRLISLCLMITFVTTMVITPRAQAGVMGLPAPGTMVNLSSSYVPLMLTGLTVHPENPLLMDFIVSTGNDVGAINNRPYIKKESNRLIKYFLACLTIPENDQWVNLSPYEKQRIIPKDLGQTVLGQDMLAQDYLLKQLTASLIYPEKNLGKAFWDKVYAQARQMYGTTQIPVNTFNKVWILPDTAKVYEHKDTVFVVKSHLKVMLDEDYLALFKHNSTSMSFPNVSVGNPEIAQTLDPRPSTKTFEGRLQHSGVTNINTLGSQIIRQLILPSIEQEVNTGKNFANLRQIYNSMILAVWFKKNLKQALLNQVYTDKAKINGVNVDDPAIKEKIYQQYLQAYKKGVFNYIKEEPVMSSPNTNQTMSFPNVSVGNPAHATIARKYFSGGLKAVDHVDEASLSEELETLRKAPLESKTFDLAVLVRDASGKPNSNIVQEAVTIGSLPEAMDEVEGKIFDQAMGATPIQIDRGVAYWAGEIGATQITRPFRASRQGDVSDVTEQSSSEKLRLENIAIQSLLKGQGVIGMLVAGASSRMNVKDAPPDVRSMSHDNIQSKAGIPIGVIDSQAVTYLDAFGINVSRLMQQINEEAKNAGINNNQLDQNEVLLMSNDDYKNEQERIIADHHFYGLYPEQFRFFNQPIDPIYWATPADVEQLKSKFNTEDDYLAALAKSKDVEARLAKGEKDAVIANQRDPLGHGEFLHQLIVSGELLHMFDTGKKWFFIKNVDNYAAKFDRVWLQILGKFLDQGNVDFQPEVSPRAPGQKGGSLIVMEDTGSQQLAEDPTLNATKGTDGKPKVNPTDSFWLNDAVAIGRPEYVASLYFKPGQNLEEFLAEYREAVKNNDKDALENIAERGRAKFPKLIDPKPAKDGPGATAKVETNMWQSTGVAPANMNIQAIGVRGARNFNINDYPSMSPEEKLTELANLRFLATKQWTVSPESRAETKTQLAALLGRDVTDTEVDLTLESYEGNKRIADDLLDYILHADLVTKGILSTTKSTGASPAMMVNSVALKNIDLKGEQAQEPSSKWTDDLIKSGRIGEYVVEGGVLKLKRVDFRGVLYRAGETKPEDYLVDEKVEKLDINDENSPYFLNQEQQENIKLWIKAHEDAQDNTVTRTPRIRLVLGDIAIHFNKDIQHSYILRTDQTDNVLYIGEVLLKFIFSNEQEDLRTELSSVLTGQNAEDIGRWVEHLDPILKKLYLDESEKLIARLSKEYDIDVNPETKIAFHMMPPYRLKGSETYKNNTQSLQAMQTNGGGKVNVALLPVGGDAESMHDAQRVIAYIRYNPRVIGMIPAAGFKDKVADYLDEVTPISRYLGVDPVYKDAEGKLKGDLDLGNSQAKWFEQGMGRRIEGSRIVILGGAGVTGMAAAYEFVKRGVASVVITDIDTSNLSRAHRIVSALLQPEERSRISIYHGNSDLVRINNEIAKADVIFNSTDLGKPPNINRAPQIEYALAGNGQLWVDLNYRPKRTLFLMKVLKYAQNTTARIDNAIDLTGFINASHLVYFLSGTEYGDQHGTNFVPEAQVYQKTVENWRKALKESALSPADQILSENATRVIPTWQSDGVPREFLNMADQFGFKVVRRELGGGKISYSIRHKQGYQPPPLDVKGLYLVRGAETLVSTLAPNTIRGGEEDHIEGQSELTPMGSAQVKIGAGFIVDRLRQAIANKEVDFIASSAPSAVKTMEIQLGHVNNIVSETDGPKFHLNLDIHKTASDVIESPVDIRDRMAGYWGGLKVEDLMMGRGGVQEAEIADAVNKLERDAFGKDLGSDAFGKAEIPGKAGIPPENTIMVIKRALDFIKYINETQKEKDVVVYINGFMMGVLQFILVPGLFSNLSHIDLTPNMPKRGIPYDIIAAQKKYNASPAMTAEEIETLQGAEAEISKILEGQFQRGDITEVVYRNALQNTYNNLYKWTTDQDIYRIDPSIRQINLEAIRQGRWDDIIEAYRQEVSFGTAGIRGKAVLSFDELQKFVEEGPLGSFLKGPNTINAFKLLKTTAGLIRFAKETGRKRIVIGYDSRIGGEQFAQMITRLFIAQSTPDYQFQIFLFDEASPFPELSFGITTEEVNGDIGILISASHNPADYNGYKITLGNGAQLNQTSKDAVVAAIAKVKNSEVVLANSLSDAKSGQLIWLGGDQPLEGKNYYGFDLIDMHSLYLQQTKRFILNKQAVAEYGNDVRIGYAAFNGAGFKAVPRLLTETGFTKVQVISKLQQLDGTFPAFQRGEQPDPGDPIAADIAVKEFIEEHGQEAFDDLDILIGTDPDADRMGLIVKVPETQQKLFGKYRLLSANDAWTLLLWYRLMMKQQMGLLQNPVNHTVVFSHVTTDALEAVAREFGIEPAGKMLDMSNTEDRGDYLSGRRTWVGFTYLAEALEDMEQAGKFVEMLAEESNGVSIQGHTKEKDGTLAAVLMAEIAAYAKSQNTTIFELLDKIYAQIGHYATANKPLPRVGSFEKAAGISEKIKIIQKSQEWGFLSNKRAGTADPFMIAGKKVIGAVQFASGRIDKSHYEGVPDEGVRFFFEDETMKPGDHFTNSRNYITIRASGTSQALRFYTQIFSKEVTPERKAVNYHEAERIALEAQKQILEDVGLAKHLSSVTQQLEFFNTSGADKAALVPEPGGIDLNSKHLNMQSEGQKMNITFNPAMIAQFRRGDFSGVKFQILDVVPINLMPLLGLKEDEESGQLAKV